MTDRDVLTLDEVAAFLRIEPADARQLLDDGKLAGFKVAGEWRILWVALADFLRREMEATQQEALARTLSDPRAWAREMRRDPEYVAQIMEQEFKEGTMGAWLKDALRAEEKEAASANVVRLEPKRE